MRVEELARAVAGLNDQQVWQFVMMCVSFAGERAQHTGNIEVEAACVEFANTMHNLVGTPEVKDLSVQ